MKVVRLTLHAQEQCIERGTDETEITTAIRDGNCEPAKKGRYLYRINFQYNKSWQGKFYAIKQVAPVVVEEETEFVVITVYTFYF
jgi:hypothetical protein